MDGPVGLVLLLNITWEAAVLAGAYRYAFRGGDARSTPRTRSSPALPVLGAAIVTANVKNHPMTDIRVMPLLP